MPLGRRKPSDFRAPYQKDTSGGDLESLTPFPHLERGGGFDLPFQDSHSNERLYPGERLLSHTPLQSSTLSSEEWERQTAVYQPRISSNSTEQQKLECPVFKYETSRGLPHSCNGVAAQTMSDVRRHLTRPHRGGRSHLQFLRRCATCKEDILDQDEFEARHGEHGEFCDTPRKQRRGHGASIEEWTSLYSRLYPSDAPTNTFTPQYMDTFGEDVVPDIHGSIPSPVASQFETAGADTWSRTDGVRATQYDDFDYVGSLRPTTPTWNVYVNYVDRTNDDNTATAHSEYEEQGRGRPDSSRLAMYTGLGRQPFESTTTLLAGMAERNVPPQLDNWLQEVESDPLHFLDDIPRPRLRLEPGTSLTVPSAWPEERESVASHQPTLPSPSDTPMKLNCPSCAVSFTGNYRRGNLQRHIRQKHGQQERHRHTCEVCQNEFVRSDALFKHYRKRHPDRADLAPPPAVRKYAKASDGPASGAAAGQK